MGINTIIVSLKSKKVTYEVIEKLANSPIYCKILQKFHRDQFKYVSDYCLSNRLFHFFVKITRIFLVADKEFLLKVIQTLPSIHLFHFLESNDINMNDIDIAKAIIKLDNFFISMSVKNTTDEIKNLVYCDKELHIYKKGLVGYLWDRLYLIMLSTYKEFRFIDDIKNGKLMTEFGYYNLPYGNDNYIPSFFTIQDNKNSYRDLNHETHTSFGIDVVFGKFDGQFLDHIKEMIKFGNYSWTRINDYRNAESLEYSDSILNYVRENEPEYMPYLFSNYQYHDEFLILENKLYVPNVLNHYDKMMHMMIHPCYVKDLYEKGKDDILASICWQEHGINIDKKKDTSTFMREFYQMYLKIVPGINEMIRNINMGMINETLIIQLSEFPHLGVALRKDITTYDHLVYYCLQNRLLQRLSKIITYFDADINVDKYLSILNKN